MSDFFSKLLNKISKSVSRRKPTKWNKNQIKLDILQLEERITPATLPGFNKAQQIDEALKQAILNFNSEKFNPTPSREVVIIDSSLIASIPQAEFAGSLVVPIDNSRDVVDQISTALNGLEDVSVLRVISHGSDGRLWFGNQSIDSATLASRSIDISAWGQSLTAESDILLYGCSVASTDDGRRFVEQFASLTHSDIAASTDATGQGGNTDLEFAVGQITAGLRATEEAYEAAGVALSTVPLVDPNTGEIIGTMVPFEGFKGEIRTIVGDTNGDGKMDMVVAAGAGGGPAIMIMDSETGEVTQSFFAFDPEFAGGVYITLSDVNNDGSMDIIAGAGKGGGPHVKIFDGSTGRVLKSFFAYAEEFRGGVSVASVDINQDGILDLITGAGPGGSAHVKVYNGANGNLISEWFAYPIDFKGGVYVAAGDIGNIGRFVVVTGAGSGGAPVVAVWDPLDGMLIAQFMAYDSIFTGGVRVGVSDGNFDGVLDLITGPGPGGAPQVKGFSFPTLDLLFSFYSGDPTNTEGVFVS
jgi:hypothetical protein